MRKPVGVEVRAGEATHSGDIFFESGDLSVGGAFLESEFFFEVGEQFSISFALPGTHRIAARARVVWIADIGHSEAPTARKGKPGMGIEFVELRADDRKLIADFLATQG
ncbi:MAG: PilZ domain-containing protein [Deltaproteobacteria bacterium]|nr:PilZ domain-containing protein [Deltaproteobacteria bacterium]